MKRYWDYYSRFPELYFTRQFGDVILKRLAPYMPRTGVVLDLGCGTGFLIGHLLDRGYKVWGVDSSSDSLAAVKERYEGRPGFLGAFLPQEGGSFPAGQEPDVVFAIEVLEHLYDEDLEGYLALLKRIARNAKVIVTVPNEEKLAEAEVFCPSCDHTFHKWQHVRSWSARSLTGVLERNGFSVEQTLVTDFSSDFGKNKKAYLKRFLVSKVKTWHLPHLAVICHVKAPV